jgi:hypothetical protein
MPGKRIVFLVTALKANGLPKAAIIEASGSNPILDALA